MINDFNFSLRGHSHVPSDGKRKTFDDANQIEDRHILKSKCMFIQVQLSQNTDDPEVYGQESEEEEEEDINFFSMGKTTKKNNPSLHRTAESPTQERDSLDSLSSDLSSMTVASRRSSHSSRSTRDPRRRPPDTTQSHSPFRGNDHGLRRRGSPRRRAPVFSSGSQSHSPLRRNDDVRVPRSGKAHRSRQNLRHCLRGGDPDGNLGQVTPSLNGSDDDSDGRSFVSARY